MKLGPAKVRVVAAFPVPSYLQETARDPAVQERINCLHPRVACPAVTRHDMSAPTMPAAGNYPPWTGRELAAVMPRPVSSAATDLSVSPDGLRVVRWPCGLAFSEEHFGHESELLV